MSTPEFWKGLIATILVTGCLVLIGMGRDSFVQGVLTAVVVSYLGIDFAITRRRKR